MSLNRLLLSLYPRRWRQRYAEEFLALLETRPLAWLDVLDLLRGALDAHMHPCLGTSAMPLTEKQRYLSNALRNSLIIGFCAYISFLLADLGFQKLHEEHAFIVMESTSRAIGTAFEFVIAGAVVSGLAVLVGAMPIGIEVIRQMFGHKKKLLLLLLGAPFLFFALYVGAVEIIVRTSLPHMLLVDMFPWWIGGLIFFGGFVLVAAVSTVSVCAIVIHSPVSARWFRFAILPASIATAAMALAFLATVIWGLRLQSEAPQLLASHAGIMRSSTIESWLLIIGNMGLSTCLAASALWRAVSARRSLQRCTPA